MTSANVDHLSRLLSRAAAIRPDHPAVEDEAGAVLSYADLLQAADRLATRLSRWGIGREDRVGLFLPKSLESVAAIHGILRAGAAYVPVDPTAPAGRGAGILADAHVRAVVVAADLAEALKNAWPGPGPLPRLIVVGDVHGTDPEPEASDAEADATWRAIQDDASPAPLTPPRDPDDLAYILYTSGSTGRPKGVMLTHANAECFLGWCAETFDVGPDDRFSSHAPFHFDLSVFDLHMAARVAGTVVLIGEATAKDPVKLGLFLAAKRPSVWYSAPSVLSLLAQYGGLERPDVPAPRLVLFAGEVFPIRHLRRLRNLWPAATLWNLYGPTETNVCTAQPIPAAIDDDRADPFPIGAACPPLRARVIDEAGEDVAPGALGELVIAGPGVMRGYFGRPDLDAAAFLKDDHGIRWYRTGDLVRDLDPDGAGRYQYHGRRDRMVKRRGCRIELGEVEAALHRHDDVHHAAVVARNDESGTTLAAFVALKPGRKASIIAMKRHCTAHLPHSMIPDTVAFLPALPMTSTDKVDYQGLASL
jgi:amino acid adenylation domain-containing protein